MKILARLSIPVPEVSGLCVGLGPAGERRLYAVGDRGDGVAWAPLSDAGEVGPWEVLPAERIAGWNGLTQLEAVAAAGPGQVILVAEEPAVVALVDVGAAAVVSLGRLEVPADHDLRSAWDADPNSRVEGALALRGGGIVAAKEKRPPALVLFGAPEATSIGPDDVLRPGEEYAFAERLEAWAYRIAPSGLADLSDLALTPDGSLAVLSDQSRAIGIIGLPLTRGITIDYTAVHELPKAVKKPEGLAWLSDGVVAVASDTKKPKDNLTLLSWP